MNVIVSHPTGNENVRALLRGLSDRGLLQRYETTLAIPAWLSRLPPAALREQLGRRSYPGLDGERIGVHPWREMLRLSATRLGGGRLTRHEDGWASVDAVYRALDRVVARSLDRAWANGARAIYAYEDGAEESFRAAGEIGLTRFYELPTAYWRTAQDVFKNAADQYPDWTDSLPGLKDSPAKMERKTAEIMSADVIFAPSRFVARSVEALPGVAQRLRIAPYGAPPPSTPRPTARNPGEPLKLLFAGRLSLAKGLPVLIQAIEALSCDWRLTTAGQTVGTPPPSLSRLLGDDRCRWLGQVPHQTLMREMASAHVFVFPSLLEGFGMVLTEAMSAGLPIISTTNTAAADLIEDGEQGYIIPVCDTQALADRITRLADDEDLRMSMGQSALKLARRSSWSSYETHVSEQIQDLLATP